MNKMKRTLAAALGCILAISGLTACGSSQSDGTETLEYMGAPATGTPQRKAIEKLVAKFEKANPGINIKLVTGTSSPTSRSVCLATMPPTSSTPMDGPATATPTSSNPCRTVPGRRT